MNEKQRQAIKNFDNYKLLDMYNSYYIKMINSLVPPAEDTAIYDGLRAEILERMQKGVNNV